MGTHWVEAVDNSSMGTHTRPTSHWVEAGGSRLTIALWGHIVQKSHCVEHADNSSIIQPRVIQDRGEGGKRERGSNCLPHLKLTLLVCGISTEKLIEKMSMYN